MIWFFFTVLTSGLPKYSIIFVTSEYQWAFERFADLLNSDKEELCYQAYDISSQYYCRDLYKALQTAKVSSGSDINDKLKKVSKYGEYLFVICNDMYQTINFNNLKARNVVFLSYEPNMYSDYHINMLDSNSFQNFTINLARVIQKVTRGYNDKDIQSFSDLCEKITRKYGKAHKIENPTFSIGTKIKEKINGSIIAKTITEDDTIIKNLESETIRKTKKLFSKETQKNTQYEYTLLNVAIEGNIKKKVSYLSVTDIVLNIVKDDLNCHSLFMRDTIFDSNSKMVKTTYFATTPKTTTIVTFDKVRVQQYGYLMYGYKECKHLIEFQKDNYCIKSSNDGLPSDKCYPAPKKCGRVFNWIAYGNTYYLQHSNEPNIGENEVNISLISSYPQTTLKAYYFYSANFIVDEWTNSHKPKVTITYNKNWYSLTTYDLIKNGFTVNSENPYEYVPLNKEPFIIDSNLIGVICGVVFIVLMIIIFIVIAVIYRPKKDVSIEEEINAENEQI